MALSRRMAVAVALVTALAGHGQEAAAQFGFRGGVNLSKFVGGDATTDAKTRLNLGASIPLLHIGPISVVPEVYYAQRGGDRQLNTTVGGVVNPVASFSMNYIEVPLLLRLGFHLVGPFSAYVGGGPSYAWQLKCDVSFAALAAQSGGEEQDCKETQFSSARTALKSADRGAVGNAGINLSVGPVGALNLDFRVVRGLARIVEDEDGPDVKSQSVSLMLGYQVLGGGSRGFPR
jgi:outer membrane protein with beta-barrel domain